MKKWTVWNKRQKHIFIFKIIFLKFANSIKKPEKGEIKIERVLKVSISNSIQIC